MDADAQDRRSREDRARALLQLTTWGDSELDQAIGLHDLLEAPDAAPAAVSTELRRRLVTGLRERYRLRHESMDEVRAEIFASGVLDQPAGLARRLLLLNYLGVTRFHEFRSGALTALDDAIEAFTQLDRAVQVGGPDATAILGDLYPGALNGLAAALSTRYSVRRELLLLDVGDTERDAIRDDLRRAIEVSRRVLASGSASQNLPGRVTLGTSLAQAAEDDTGQINAALIDEAISLLDSAYRAMAGRTGPGQRELQLGTADRLAVALQLRGRLADTDRAIDLLTSCCEQAGPDLMYAAGGRLSLASARARRWQLTGRKADERAARSAYVDAWRAGLRHHLPAAFDAATQQGGWAWMGGRWAEAGEAYSRGVRTLHIAARSLASWQDKHLTLRKAPGVAARAAYGLARVGRVDQALVTLETGRGVLLAEMLDRRAIDYERIARAVGPGAAHQYQYLTARLTEMEAQALASDPAAADAARDCLEAVRRDRDMFIRTQTGGAALTPSDPPTVAELRSAAGPVPVVHLAATSQGGVALLVSPGPQAAIRAVSLPELTTEMVLATVGAFWTAVRTQSVAGCEEVCEALWYLAMGDLEPYLEDAERVILIPGGSLAVLPWHAAKIPGRHQRHLLDRVAVSYAPNIRSLPPARAAAAGLAGTISMLAVGQPEPTSAAPLDTAAEIAAIRAQQSRDFRVAELPGREASRAAVLGALSRYQAVHFAGHASAQPVDPLASALLTARDVPLTVRDLMTQGVGATRFAVLSACETARAGDELTDELISLPTALLQCGLAGVVASLWQVYDRPTTVIMSAFYENWRQEGLSPALALRAAQLWARDRGYPSPLAWASFVHEGP